MIRRIQNWTLLEAADEATLSEKILVEDFRHLALYVQLAAATTTIKVKISYQDDVDFSAASTINNAWTYADLKSLDSGGTTVNGSTGISATTGTSQKGYAINVDMAKWVAVDVEALSAGTVSILLSGATNE